MWCICDKKTKVVFERYSKKAQALYYAAAYPRGSVYVEWRSS